MSYSYAELRPGLFTEEGQVRFIAVRDRARDLLEQHGQATLDQIIHGFTGSDWDHVACVDRMVELRELCVVARGEVMQHNLYRGKWSPRRP